MARVLGWWIALVFGVWILTACNQAVAPGEPMVEGDTPMDEETPSDADGDQIPESKFAVFDDPDTDFSTSDVRDVDEEIVRFDREMLAIVWAADETSFDAGMWDVNGNLLAGGFFSVRFGTKDGQRRAYFTETATATICDIFVESGSLLIFPTSVPVPQE